MAPVNKKNVSATKLALQYLKIKAQKPNYEEVKWEVDSIIGHGKRFGELHYLVRWKGEYKPTFEPAANLYCEDVLQKYHQWLGRDPRNEVKGNRKKKKKNVNRRKTK